MDQYKILDYRTSLGRLVKQMAKDCKELVETAIATSKFTNRTYNLHDSYGAAVYLDGELREETIYYKEPLATQGKKFYGELIDGHEEMLKYLKKYRPRKKGLTIVLVAAVPYVDILERGGGYLTRKYKVIVGAHSLMRKLAVKYGGKFGRRRKSRSTIHVGYE